MKIGISYTPPPSASQSTFEAGFGLSSVLADRWRWRMIVSRLLFKNTEFFGNRESENLYLLPAHLDLDDSTEFTDIDPVHPHPVPGDLTGPSGYRRIARGYYAWLRAMLSDEAQLPVAIPESAERQPDVAVFPNPSSGNIRLLPGPAIAGAGRVALLNSVGTIVNTFSVVFTGNEPVPIALGNLPGGSYLLKVELPGGRTVVKRLVRQ
jgi:hypothetical protein